MILLLLHLLIQAGLIVRILLRPNRQPASRIAWILVILAVPVIGAIVYLLLGEVSLGRHRRRRLGQLLARIPEVAHAPHRHTPPPAFPETYRQLFRVGQSISGFAPVSGNRARLTADSNASIAAMVADIDAAVDHVHLLFYIWLPDINGLRMAAALERAAARGVVCRAMVDDLARAR